MNGHLPPWAAARLSVVLSEEEESRFGRLALRRRLITQEQLDLARDERLRTGRPLAAILLAREWLSATQLDDLRDELARSTAAPEAPAEVQPILDDPSRRVAEFVIVSSLGRGGGGEVWKAWDSQLGRWVAIKMPALPALSRTAAERFHREGLAIAKLAHPNIVPVYRVAEHEGRPYIVMQLVAGRTLNEVRLPLRRALEVMRAAAGAVHYAHQHGVVHRDVKPGNIMVDDQGGVWMLDFGLAHLAEQQGLTASGAVLGTPCYMSPEQARGEPRARQPATDVYGLGATLYELATGQPPFVGDAMAEIVRQVTDQEPVPPRRIDARLPQDVETIVLKAMAKDPRRRYSTAADLAEDLRRHLGDEPITARPTSHAYRFYRRLRRNPFAWGSCAAALVAAGVAIGIWFAGSARVERGQAAALEEMRRSARIAVEFALEMRRKGENRSMRRFERDLDAAYANTVKVAPGVAETDYWKGRFHRAVMEHTRALEFQNLALSKDPRHGPSLYERVVLRMQEYDREFERAVELARARALSPRSMAREDVERLNPSLASLRRSIARDCHDAVGLVSAAQQRVIRAFVAVHERRLDEAQELLSAAVAEDPLLEEGWGELAYLPIIRAWQASDVTERLKRFEDARDLYAKAREQDRGYLPHVLWRAATLHDMAEVSIHHGRDPTAALRDAESDYHEALTLDGDCVEARAGLGGIAFNRGFWHERRDPIPHYDAALGHFSAAIDARDDGRTRLRRARVRLNRGVWLGLRGRDPSNDFAAGEVDTCVAMEMRADLAGELHEVRGAIRAMRGHWLKNRGGDPSAQWERAETDYVEAMRLLSDAANPRMRCGALATDRGTWREARGEDPWPDWEAALTLYSTAIDLEPGIAEPLLRRGILRANRAANLLTRRTSPLSELDAAARDLNAALEINGRLAEAFEALGGVHLNRGAWRAGVREDASSDWDRAEICFSSAIELDPSAPGPLTGRAMVHFNRGFANSANGPLTDWEKAETDLLAALKLNATCSETLVKVGQVRYARAQYHDVRGRAADAQEAYGRSADAFDRAIAINRALARTVGELASDARRRAKLAGK